MLAYLIISIMLVFLVVCSFVSATVTGMLVTQFSGSGYGYDVTCIRAVYLDGKVLYWWLQ